MDFQIKRSNLEWRCEMVDGELQFQILYQNKGVFKPYRFEREVLVKTLNEEVFKVLIASCSHPAINSYRSRRVVIFLRGDEVEFDDFVCTPSNRHVKCGDMHPRHLMIIVNSALRSISELVDKELSDGLSN